MKASIRLRVAWSGRRPVAAPMLSTTYAGLAMPGMAQFFLKYIVSHPSRPIAIPGTDQVRYVDDNLGAARGRLPDAALRTRMERFIDEL